MSVFGAGTFGSGIFGGSSSGGIDYVEIHLTLPGGQIRALPKFTTAAFDVKYNEHGVIEFKYPTVLAAEMGLKDQSMVTAYVGIAGLGTTFVDHYIVDATSEEKVSDGLRITTFSGVSLLKALEDAVVYPSNWPVTQPSGHEFVELSIGNIFRTLILRAKDRGALLEINETTFTGTTDSNGAVWAHLHSQNYENGKYYYAILQEFMERGLADAWVDQNKNLHIVNGGTRGVHISNDAVEVRPAKNATEIVVATSSTDSVTAVLIEGETGTSVEQVKPEFQSTLGRRRERFVSQGGIADAGILTVLANAELELYARIPAEETVGISNSSEIAPFASFGVSDWIWVRYETSQAPVERRVRQLAVSVSENREVTFGMTLGTILNESDVALARKIEAYTGGGGTYGSIPNTSSDNTVPNVCHTFSINSSAYITSTGGVETAFSATWLGPSTNVGGSAYTDGAGYEFQWRYVGDPYWGAEYPTTNPSFQYSPTRPGVQIEARVRAVDTTDHKSEWIYTTHTLALDATPPPKPAFPIAASRLGSVHIFWSGLTSTGNPQPLDFSYAEIHASTSSGFTPTLGANTRVASVRQGGAVVLSDIGYNTTWYYKVIAVDTSGNASVPSDASAPVTVTALVNTDLIGAVIAGANLLPNTVTMKNLAIGDFENFCPDFSLVGNRTDWMAAASSAGSGVFTWSEDTIGVAVEKWRLRAEPSLGSGDGDWHFEMSDKIPIKEDDEFWILADLYRSDAASFGISLGFRLYNAAGTVVASSVSPQAILRTAGSLTSETWTSVSGAVVIPPGLNATHAVIEFRTMTSGTGADTGYWMMRRPIVRRRSRGNLIVDGSVTATQIASLAINTGHLAANAVTASKIDVGAVTADKIHVSNKNIALNDNSNFEEEAVNEFGASLNVPKNWACDIGYPNDGSLSFETITPLAGTKSARVTIPAGMGARLHYTPTGGVFLPVNPGEKYYVSARVLASGGTPTGDGSHLTFHTAPAGVWPYAVLSSAVWGDLDTGKKQLANGQDYVFEGTATVPAGHNVASISIWLQPRTAAATYIIDDFRISYAVGNDMITDIRPGKITTGLMSASTKIVAGGTEPSEGVFSGSRVEMSSAGYAAYNSSNVRTFFVRSSDGQATVGDQMDPSISLSVHPMGSVFGGSFSQAAAKFNKAGWNPGTLAANHWVDGGFSWSSLRLQSHWEGANDQYTSEINSAYIDLRSRSGGTSFTRSMFYVKAQEANFNATTFIFGSSDGSSVDFRLRGSNQLVVSDFGQASQFQINSNWGQTVLRAQQGPTAGSPGIPQNMEIQAAQLSLNPGNGLMIKANRVDIVGGSAADLYLGPSQSNGRKWIGVWGYWGSFQGTDRLGVKDATGNFWGPIGASSFDTVSDQRLKENVQPVVGALEALKNVPVYDFNYIADRELVELVPIVHAMGDIDEEHYERVKNSTAPLRRGVLAQELQQQVPHAVTTGDDGFLSVGITDLLGTAIAAIRELSDEVDLIKAELNSINQT